MSSRRNGTEHNLKSLFHLDKIYNSYHIVCLGLLSLQWTTTFPTTILTILLSLLHRIFIISGLSSLKNYFGCFGIISLLIHSLYTICKLWFGNVESELPPKHCKVLCSHVIYCFILFHIHVIEYPSWILNHWLLISLACIGRNQQRKSF